MDWWEQGRYCALANAVEEESLVGNGNCPATVNDDEVVESVGCKFCAMMLGGNL